MKNLVKIFALVVFVCGMAFAAETAPVVESAAPAKASAESAAAPVAESAAPAVESAAADPVAQMQAEIAIRDSVMAVQKEACRVEKDSLRGAINIEQAKSANWEQSYNTIRKDNEVCAQALSVSLGVNENKKDHEEQEKRNAAMMTSSSFLGGIAIGMLLFWLIFD